MRRITVVKIVAVLTVLLFAVGLYAALPDRNRDWESASTAPEGLMEVVVSENISPNFQADVSRMKILTVQQSGQRTPLYLIDTRIADPNHSSLRDPLCGVEGCAFFGYRPANDRYQKVLGAYFNPLLPRGISLFEMTTEVENGLPKLQVNQLERNQIQQLMLTFNGSEYEITETRLLPQNYE